MDHISGVPQHATKRSLYGMKPAIYYTPEHLVDSLASVCEGYAKMAENVPVLEQMDIDLLNLESLYMYVQFVACKFEPCSWRGTLDTALCDKVRHLLVTSRWFSLGTPVSSTNKTDRHNITEI